MCVVHYARESLYINDSIYTIETACAACKLTAEEPQTTVLDERPLSQQNRYTKVASTCNLYTLWYIWIMVVLLNVIYRTFSSYIPAFVFKACLCNLLSVWIYSIQCYLDVSWFIWMPEQPLEHKVDQVSVSRDRTYLQCSKLFCQQELCKMGRRYLLKIFFQCFSQKKVLCSTLHEHNVIAWYLLMFNSYLTVNIFTACCWQRYTTYHCPESEMMLGVFAPVFQCDCITWNKMLSKSHK